MQSLTKFIHQLTERLKRSYSLDVRALSVMRIGIGIILLTDLFIRSLSIKAFFTDEGVLPVEILKNYNLPPYYFSLHAASGELWWQILLFVLNALCIILLIVGFRTRVFTFICWVFLTSLQNRNPFILQGGDDLLRLMLLWGIFLPWGERYSVKKISYYPNTYFSFINIGYMLLVCSVYFFSALLKTHAEWHAEGTAIYYALSLDQIRLPLGTFLYQFPMLMKVLTWAVYYVELIAPLFIIMPFVNYRIRIIGIILLAVLHIGIAGSLYVGLFYIIGLVTLIGLLPTQTMNCFKKPFFNIGKTNVIVEKHLQPLTFTNEIINRLKNGFIILIISFCLLLNLGNVKRFPYMLDLRIVKFGSLLRLEQSWGMFSPYILKDDGFFVYSGYAGSGKFINIKRGGAPTTFNKPTNIVSTFESDRWRKFSENYTFNNNNFMRPYYCDYLLKKWNKEHPDKHIVDLTIFYMKEVSLPDYKTKPLEKNALCNCIDNQK